jgi:hypothetical protein
MSISIDHNAGVSWGAIFAGAACAASLSFILLILGFGLGLSAVSPWSNTGASLATIGISSIIWVALTQIIASGMGGYITGRLRVRWASIHSDEVYFRDTAHGLITWSVATLAAAVFLTSTLATVFGGTVRAGTETGGEIAGAATEVAASITAAPSSYFADSLLRAGPDASAAPASDSVRAEVSTIFLHGLAQGEISAADSQYLASVISRSSGISQNEASTRIAQVTQQAQQFDNEVREAADTARRATAYSALWMFIALLCGAFVASLMATFGGRQRDAIS